MQRGEATLVSPSQSVCHALAPGNFSGVPRERDTESSQVKSSQVKSSQAIARALLALPLAARSCLHGPPIYQLQMFSGEQITLEVEYCSSEAAAYPSGNVLDGDGAHWQAADNSATLQIALQPPSPITSILLTNAGCAEVSVIAMGQASSAGSYLGSAAPRHDYRAVGDAVQLLPAFRLSAPRGMVVFRVGRGEGRLSSVATTQPWTHIELKVKGLRHNPGLSQVQILRPAAEAVPAPLCSPSEEVAVPLCSKHKLKGVLTTVKKDGPNRGRPFYICPMPRADCCGFVAWRDPTPSQPPPFASQPPASQRAMGLPAAARDDFSTWSQRNANDALTAAGTPPPAAAALAASTQLPAAAAAAAGGVQA